MSRDELIKDLDDKRALFGLFFSFDNRLQQAGDQFYDEITCKQFFLLICLSLFTNIPPTIGDLADVMGSSHQNVKQIVLKLEKLGYLQLVVDEKDHRKLRVLATSKIEALSKKYYQEELLFMEALYEGLTDEEIKLTFKTMKKIEDNLIKIKGDKK